MKGQPDFTIVYVFGPMQCEEKYFNDELLSREASEWVKIGETLYRGNIDDVTPDSLKDAAMNRIKNESRTGIPFVSKIFDVFIFPFKPKTDDLLRKRLCNELFEIENSKQVNQQLKELDDKYIIKSGQEFVYDIKRSKIKYAVQSVDHDLIVDAEQKNDVEEIKLMAKICRCNDIDIDNSTTENEDTALVSRKPRLDLDLIFNDEDREYIVILTDGSGNEVKDENGEAITAKYIGGNMFECRGESGRSSYFAKKYLNMYAGKNMQTVNGNEYWTYNGQKLTSLRKN